MYWILGSGLLRHPASFYGPVDADPVITALEDGPAQALYVPGLETAIARGGVVRSATTAGNRIVVDLDPAYESGMGGQQLLGLAQLALTFTSMPGIRSVEFDVNGRNVAVPTSAQAAVTRPVDKADYIGLLSR
jgi:spore germination protein GerM